MVSPACLKGRDHQVGHQAIAAVIGRPVGVLMTLKMNGGNRLMAGRGSLTVGTDRGHCPTLVLRRRDASAATGMAPKRRAPGEDSDRSARIAPPVPEGGI